MPTLPSISPRGAKPAGKTADPASKSAQPEAGDPINVWTPHDVAEWLYMQSTKDDYTHTFLVHGIDGPALQSLTKQRLLEWKVKPVDITTILKGIEMLKRIASGNIGWAPGADAGGDVAELLSDSRPKPPKGPKPMGKSGRKSKPTAAAPAAAEAHDAEADLSGEGDGAAAPAAEWALTSVNSVPPTTRRTQGGTHRDDLSGQKTSPASPSYLRKMISELHTSERVPLWKEEMVERVKRTATARQQKQESAYMSSSAPASARGKFSGTSTSGRLESSRTKVADVDSMEETGMSRTGGSSQAREIERKLFWYQDAIHEQELQQQLLDQKIRALNDDLGQALETRVQMPNRSAGIVNKEKENTRKLQGEKNSLSRSLKISEERVADAERLNTYTESQINKLRRGRADFLQQVARLEERTNQMVADMKVFAAAAHASLDEKEKVESRLKRLQFDYRNELATAENVFETLQAELQSLDEKISAGYQAEEEEMQRERQERFRKLKGSRESDNKRELKLGYLQNHVRGQEMDFQRLHRIMGVKFTPEKPDSVQDIVAASLSHEQRNSSLLHFVSVQNQQIEDLEIEIRALEKDAEKLKLEQSEQDFKSTTESTMAKEKLATDSAVEAGIEKREGDLKKIVPAVERLCGLTQIKEDDPKAAIAGCRADTLPHFLRLIDVQIGQLKQRANEIEHSSNEWLRDFLAPAVVEDHPPVTETRRELEAQASAAKEMAEKRESNPNAAADPVEAPE